jgi:hypothetical protein
MTPTQYAKQQFTAGRMVNMPVYDVAGSFYLCDADWNILPGSKTYATKDAAVMDRSRILDRARKHIA